MLRMTHTVGLMLTGVALSALSAPAVRAQAAPPTGSGESPASRRFDIPAGPLAPALNAWSRRTGRSILFQSKQIASSRSAGAEGRMSDDAALDALLSGTGLVRIDGERGSVAITSNGATADNAGNATPDILVTGRRAWSLNTGVQRSQDDSQPFIVMSREEIQRSGAPNLETFLRDRLNVNTSPGTSEQTKPGSYAGTSTARGLSSINLRGIGTRDTLILVDGRRQPGVNIGDGTITQTSITGIPIAAIERIEVLASSASGIYGSGASGGVINIVLKRDYTGGEISATYSDTSDLAQGQGQVDLTYGLPLEGGRTRVSVTGSWLKTRPLLFGDRADLAQRAISHILSNDPDALRGNFSPPPIATTPNYKTIDGTPLQLKPAFGGATLATAIGTIPAGYGGVPAGGLPALLAGVGTYNFQAPDSTFDSGLRAPLLYGSQRMSGSLSVRREFNPWLTGYAGLTLSRADSIDFRSRGLTYVYLAADAPNNPFTQQLQVSLPGVAQVAQVRNRQDGSNLIGGVIAKLPGGWQAALDLSYSRSRFRSDTTPSAVDDATGKGLASGSQDILRDVVANPLTIGYDALPFYTARTPGRASSFAPSLRVAGPLPVRLPGGRPQMTINIEYDDERIGAVTSARNTGTSSSVNFTPSARQQTRSIYGEVAFPLIGAANHVPLIRELELRVSARAERYTGDGADPYSCTTLAGPLPAGDPYTGCPPADAAIARSTTSNSHVDPSISLRWTPVAPLMLRGSYTTGYLPPTLAQLVRVRNDALYVSITDPQRGNEPVGIDTGYGGSTIPGFVGGNPNVRPEASRTLSAGAVLTPGLVSGLRISADWTRIRKRDVYFDPAVLSFAFVPGAKEAFDLFLAANPGRVTRGPASGGYPVGPITSIDLSLVNLVGLRTDTVDFVLDYHHDLLGGVLDVISRATYVPSLDVEGFPGFPAQNYAGVVNRDFATAAGVNGSLRWRGSVAANWTRDRLTLGWQGRYFDRYALNVDRTEEPGQGSVYVPSQFYNDISASYRFGFGATLRAGINNVLNRKPPIDVSAAPLYYSSYGDPRLRNFYLGMSKSF